MKRWLSISFAIGAFIGVLSVSALAMFQLQLGSLNVPSSPVAAQPASNSAASTSGGDFAAAQTFFADRGIALSTQPHTPLTHATWDLYENTSDANLRQAAATLKTEWTKYSNDTLQTSGLKAIYLVKNLRVTGQARSGMPDPITTHALYFDVSDTYLQSENGDYMRRTFHHEFSHLIEYNLFSSYDPKDAAWTGCNASNNIYGDGGANMYDDPGFAHKAHPSYGFIDGYATSAREEDKAEMFAYYMTDPAYVQKLADKDNGIACKVTQTEKLLRSL